jgi:hypothetical protein
MFDTAPEPSCKPDGYDRYDIRQEKGFCRLLRDLELYKPKGYEFMVAKLFQGHYSDQENDLDPSENGYMISIDSNGSILWGGPMLLADLQASQCNDMVERCDRGKYGHSYVYQKGQTFRSKQKRIDKKWTKKRFREETYWRDTARTTTAFDRAAFFLYAGLVGQAYQEMLLDRIFRRDFHTSGEDEDENV